MIVLEMPTRGFTSNLAALNAELLRILARAGGPSPMTSTERQAILADIARMELLFEDALANQPETVFGLSPTPASKSFDSSAAIDTTRDLIVRAKVAITRRASRG
jgi:hypothetical protein